MPRPRSRRPIASGANPVPPTATDFSMKTFHIRISTLVLTLALMLGGIATSAAADANREVAGEVTAKSANSISITTQGTKKTETFAIALETTVLRGRETTSLNDVQVGELALIHARKTGGQEVAVSITTKPRR